MKPISDMNPTELLRYNVELLKKIQDSLDALNHNRTVTVSDFDISFNKLFGVFLKALPAAFLAAFAIVLVVEATSIVFSSIF